MISSLKLPEAAGSSDNSISIITFSIPALPGSWKLQEAPGRSRKLPRSCREHESDKLLEAPEAAGSTKVIIRFQLSLSCCRQLPGASRELPGGAGILKVIIGIELSLSCSQLLPGASRSFQKLFGSFQDLPESSSFVGASRSDLYSGKLVVSTANLVVVTAEACRGYRSGAVVVTPDDLVAVTTGSLSGHVAMSFWVETLFAEDNLAYSCNQG